MRIIKSLAKLFCLIFAFFSAIYLLQGLTPDDAVAMLASQNIFSQLFSIFMLIASTVLFLYLMRKILLYGTSGKFGRHIYLLRILLFAEPEYSCAEPIKSIKEKYVRWYGSEKIAVSEIENAIERHRRKVDSGVDTTYHTSKMKSLGHIKDSFVRDMAQKDIDSKTEE